MEIIKQSPKALTKAVAILKKGGVVICPTDTIYGFLADASNKKAVEKIYKIKKRPKAKPLPVFVKDMNMAKELALIDDRQERIIKRYWPGKYTFVLKAKRRPDLLLSLRKISGRSGFPQTIALRIPKYKLLNDLLKKINKPLAQTSVNISGRPPLTKIDSIVKIIAMSDIAILLIDGGDLKKGKPSRIIDLSGKRLTRLR